MLKVWKKLWVPSAKLGWKKAELAVLFSRQLPNGSHNFLQTFSIFLKDYFIKNPQITITLPFLTDNISAIGGLDIVIDNFWFSAMVPWTLHIEDSGIKFNVSKKITWARQQRQKKCTIILGIISSLKLFPFFNSFHSI